MLLSHTTLQLRVAYDAPAFNCRRVLRILPQSRPGQRVASEKIAVFPEPSLQEERRDEFGNRRLLIVHHKIEKEFGLVLEVATETWGETLPRASGTPGRGIGAFLMPSRFVDLPASIRQQGKATAQQFKGAELAAHFCNVVHASLNYEATPHTPPPRASELLNLGAGSCQDYAHLMLAFCRAAGLPARYIAGFNPAEGQLHAWVEVFVEKQWQAFDPTHGRQPSPGCVVAALGRDYQDARPVLGDYWGGNAQLELFCRTRVAEAL